MKLSYKIFIASLLPFLLIATAYHYLSSTLFSDYLTANYRQQAENRLQHLEEDIQHFLVDYDGELQAMTTGNLPDPARPDQSREILNTYLNHDDSLVQISAITANGREWLRTSKYPLPIRESAPGNLFYNPVYQKPLLEMAPYLDYVRIEPDFTLPFFNLSIPIKNRQTGSFSGVLWLRVYPQQLQNILESSLPAMGKVMLISSDRNEIILQADDTRQDFAGSESDALREISHDKQRNGWLENDQITFLYRKFIHDGLDLTLIYYQPNQNIYSLAEQLKTYNLRVAFVGVCLFILASFILIRITISPLAMITEQIAKLGRRYRLGKPGRPEPLKKQPPDEINLLRDSFSLLEKELNAYSNNIEAEVKTRKEKEKELREIQAQLEERIKERTRTLEKTHEQLLHAEKLATSGSMAASLAHEFGNPLCGIKAVLASVAQRDTLSKDNARMVKMALDECDRMNALIQNLQDFNRPSTGEKTLTNLHRAIDDILEFTNRTLERKAITIEKEYDPVLPPLMVITDQIKQVIMNLINNSIDACANGGLITIVTNAESDKAVLRFSDNGQGIKPGNLTRIFDPFFTTKPVAMGTGLGLSVSYGIIRNHGGTIEVASKPGAGSTFTIILPINAQADE